MFLRMYSLITEIKIMKKLLIMIILLLTASIVYSQEQGKKYDFSGYPEMRKYFGKVYQEKNYMEAAKVLEWALEKYPKNILANSFNLAFTYNHLKEYDKGIKALQYALDNGIWFNKWAFERKAWDGYKKNEKFQNILDRNLAKMKEAQKTAKPDILVITPESYTKDKKYPLFIALHGGGGNIAGFKDVWISEKVRKEYICVFLQSSLIIAMNGYNWMEDIELSKKEIKTAFEKINGEYNIDKNRVIIGGFSSGGVAAMEIAFDNIFPVSGFIALCPPKPESFTEINIKAAKTRGLRGILLSTEMDPRLGVQKEMVEMMKKENFPHEFIVSPNMGHWIPKDLDVKLNNALDYISSK